MNLLAPFFAYMARRKARRAHAAECRRRDALIAQIAARQARHAEWKPLRRDLSASTHAMLRAEVTMRGIR